MLSISLDFFDKVKTAVAVDCSNKVVTSDTYRGKSHLKFLHFSVLLL